MLLSKENAIQNFREVSYLYSLTKKIKLIIKLINILR